MSLTYSIADILLTVGFKKHICVPKREDFFSKTCHAMSQMTLATGLLWSSDDLAALKTQMKLPLQNPTPSHPPSLLYYCIPLRHRIRREVGSTVQKSCIVFRALTVWLIDCLAVSCSMMHGMNTSIARLTFCAICHEYSTVQYSTWLARNRRTVLYLQYQL